MNPEKRKKKTKLPDEIKTEITDEQGRDGKYRNILKQPGAPATTAALIKDEFKVNGIKAVLPGWDHNRQLEPRLKWKAPFKRRETSGENIKPGNSWASKIKAQQQTYFERKTRLAFAEKSCWQASDVSRRKSQIRALY